MLEIGIKLLEGDTNGWIRINGQKLKDRNGKKWNKMEKNGLKWIEIARFWYELIEMMLSDMRWCKLIWIV